ncbi:nitronate monooxygenase [Nibricoccus sp. IMCC34717]|uniref:nitronate monooxygenase n=1 Tax=Nibricoccus sp. IMCC34717 TaxID=3034021 RepID=UPI003850F2F6
MTHPRIIQGGMGIGVSSWRLANAVARMGELGVVSGTALTTVVTRRLQTGDPEGDIRRALAAFPYPDIAKEVLERYFVEGGIGPKDAFRLAPMPSLTPSATLDRLTVATCFVEVFLAKEGHSGVVGMNLLEKIQTPNLASLYGAMLAGVDYVLIGAGIPRAIPGVLDAFAQGHAAELRIDVEGTAADDARMQTFDPAVLGGPVTPLKRPHFLAIISSATLALTLAKKASGKVDGFVVEGDLAGGHNAPPRGGTQLDALGQPIYGLRDIPDLVKIRELGLPFWLAGRYAFPEKLREAIDAGAAGIQVGTAFAFCRESGVTDELKKSVLGSTEGVSIFTDPKASPTGFPFKVAQIGGTIAKADVYESRERVCDMGYLRQPYKRDDGSVGYRCPAEPVEDYVAKGGRIEDTEGRKCLCNGLAATLGHGQRREDGDEAALVTAGVDITEVRRFLEPGKSDYGAADVIRYLRG